MADIFHLTEKAADKVKNLLTQEQKNGWGLRVRVVGGGCAGMQYQMVFEEKSGNEDNIVEEHGVKMFIDPQSAFYLEGTELDYLESLTGGGFKFKNPKASGSCGCGESFRA